MCANGIGFTVRRGNLRPTSPIDVYNRTGARIDIDFYITSGDVIALNLLFVEPFVRAGHGKPSRAPGRPKAPLGSRTVNLSTNITRNNNDPYRLSEPLCAILLMSTAEARPRHHHARVAHQIYSPE